MIIFSGDDTYESYISVKKFLRENYFAKGIDIVILNSDEVKSFEEINDILKNRNLFGTESAIFLKRLSENKNIAEEMEKYLESLIEQKIVIWENKSLDKRGKLYKFAKERDILFEFEACSRFGMHKWVSSLNSKLKLNLSENDIYALIEKWGNNKWAITTDLRKLYLFDENLRRTALEHILSDSYNPEKEIWDLVKAFSTKDAKRFIAELIEKTKTNNYNQLIISLIHKELKNFSLVKLFTKHGLELNKLKMHPFALKMTVENARNFDLNEIGDILLELLYIDIDLRNGKGHFCSQMANLALKYLK